MSSMSIGQIRRRYPDLDIAGGNVATGEGTTRIDRSRRQRRQSRRRSRIDLHHADRLGRRRAADHRHRQLR